MQSQIPKYSFMNIKINSPKIEFFPKLMNIVFYGLEGTSGEVVLWERNGFSNRRVVGTWPTWREVWYGGFRAKKSYFKQCAIAINCKTNCFKWWKEGGSDLWDMGATCRPRRWSREIRGTTTPYGV